MTGYSPNAWKSACDISLKRSQRRRQRYRRRQLFLDVVLATTVATFTYVAVTLGWFT